MGGGGSRNASQDPVRNSSRGLADGKQFPVLPVSRERSLFLECWGVLGAVPSTWDYPVPLETVGGRFWGLRGVAG